MNILTDLFKQYIGVAPVSCQKIAGAGSNRLYYRLSAPSGDTLIGVVGTSLRENQTFIYLTRHFASQGLPVPKVLAVCDDGSRYLQTDLGAESLYDALSAGRTSAQGYTQADMDLLEEAVRLLPRVQILGARGLDFGKCYPQEAMDYDSVMYDLNYFKYCFLKTTGVEFCEPFLEKDLRSMAEDMQAAESPYFMYRDFQARNIMVNLAYKQEHSQLSSGRLSLIDYQGGRRGALQYDLVSFLWQASSHFTPAMRSSLIDVYVEELGRYADVDVHCFRESIPRWVLFRTLQVLGAYGLRGRFERKHYFLDSIPLAIDNLREVLQSEEACPYPYLRKILNEMTELPEFSNSDSPQSSSAQQLTSALNGGKLVLSVRDTERKSKKLRLRVYSFSYKKGIPEDTSGNGGGYVFDCRSTHNPGRYEQYKSLTGLDAPVIDFLEKDGEITVFLESVYRLADAHVQRYMERGFTSLMFCFGCTGGQHRSVYSAEHLARYLNDRYGVEVSVTHREQGIHYVLPERRKAMVFAAGLGTRLRPLTDTMPKALVPVAGKPLIGHVLDKLVLSGFNDIVVNVHHHADMLEEWLVNEGRRKDYRESGVRLHISDERVELLETGGGIAHASDLLKIGNAENRFLIHNVDILSNVDLTEMWQADVDADALLLVSSRQTSRYLIFDNDMCLCGWTNIATGEVRTRNESVREALSQRSADLLDIDGYHLRAFSGIHILKTVMLERMAAYPKRFSIIDFYLNECADARIVGYSMKGMEMIDVGKIDSLDDAESVIRQW